MIKEKSKIIFFEPIVFLFFGVFHMHRIWGLIDMASYADFWLSVMDDRGWIYYILMGVLSVLCIFGILLFIKNIGNNYWWRWFYIFGGGYVLFDLFAIATGLTFWRNLLNIMFDTANPFWNIIWGGFILMGFACFIFGIWLFAKSDKIHRTIKGGLGA